MTITRIAGSPPGTPIKGIPGAAALPEDPWNADWQPREPGPTRLTEIDTWERTPEALPIEPDRDRDVALTDSVLTGERDVDRPTLLVVEEGEVLIEEADDEEPLAPDEPKAKAPQVGVTKPELTAAPSPSGHRGVRRVTRLAVYFIALTIGASLWYFSLGTLVVSRGAALVSGWDVTTILTGSMAPALSPGDLVAYAPVDPADLEVGQIIVFRNPAQPDSTLVHRISAIDVDGTLTTKGDANTRADSTPIAATAVLGAVKMVSPYGGYPTMLLRKGRTAELVALGILFLVAVIIVHAPAPGVSRRDR